VTGVPAPPLTPDELDEVLHRRGQRMVVATLTQEARPHLTVVWYGFAPDGRLAFTIPAGSQKAKNLARDPRITVLVDGGEAHGELHGAQITGQAELVDDPGLKAAIHHSVAERYPTRSTADPARTMARRVAVVITAERTISWDHRKLASRRGVETGQTEAAP
jgi:PPOX class probable F420-dependent enzyme